MTLLFTKRFFTASRNTGPRNTKGYDWYHKALIKLAIEKPDFKAIEMFPSQLGPRSEVFMEFTSGNEIIGKIVFCLVDDLLPGTCENFKRLCLGNLPFKYESTKIHRIVKNSVIMGGDVEYSTGKGGHSAFLNTKTGGKYFPDEGFIGLHQAPGVLSMTNGGIDTNNSQFFVTLSPQAQLNGRNVAFGYIKDDSSIEVLNRFKSILTFRQKPLESTFISKCGVIEN
jgi:cyclophilin family peptidyl-prolyl cis-trans isomerase